jgi:hypothetical protein
VFVMIGRDPDHPDSLAARTRPRGERVKWFGPRPCGRAYTGSLGYARTPSIDDTFTITPPQPSIIVMRNARRHRASTCRKLMSTDVVPVLRVPDRWERQHAAPSDRRC